jgi:Armadillo/beta-catenin-like repeat
VISDSHVGAVAVAQAGAIPLVVAMLESTCAPVHGAAAGVLENLSCADCSAAAAIIAAGAVPILTRLRDSPSVFVRECAATTLTHLAAHDVSHASAGPVPLAPER